MCADPILRAEQSLRGETVMRPEVQLGSDADIVEPVQESEGLDGWGSFRDGCESGRMDTVRCIDHSFGFSSTEIADMLLPGNHHRRMVVQRVPLGLQPIDTQPRWGRPTRCFPPVAKECRGDLDAVEVFPPLDKGSGVGGRDDGGGRGTFEEGGLVTVVGKLVGDGDGVDKSGLGANGGRGECGGRGGCGGQGG